MSGTLLGAKDIVMNKADLVPAWVYKPVGKQTFFFNHHTCKIYTKKVALALSAMKGKHKKQYEDIFLFWTQGRLSEEPTFNWDMEDW